MVKFGELPQIHRGFAAFSELHHPSAQVSLGVTQGYGCSLSIKLRA